MCDQQIISFIILCDIYLLCYYVWIEDKVLSNIKKNIGIIVLKGHKFSI